jgi:hypothetical protein
MTACKEDFMDPLSQGYISRGEQVSGFRKAILSEGRAKGCAVIEAWTGGGLQVDILPDTGLDIGLVRFKGNNMSYLSKNGYDSPFAFIPLEKEFASTYPGGMLYTCGLRQVGPPCRDKGEWHPQHGRYHGIPAEETAVFFENGDITIKGKVRDSALFGHVLEISRTIRIPRNGSRILIEDCLTNSSKRAEEFMILYHINFGYPMLSEKAYLELPEGETSARSEFSKAGLDKVMTVDPPQDNEEERVYFHEPQSFKAALTNPELGG